MAPRSSAIAVIAIAGGFATFFGFIANANQLTLRQRLTPDLLMGRMNAIVRLIYWSAIPVGAVLGVAASAIGLRLTLLVWRSLGDSIVDSRPLLASHV